MDLLVRELSRRFADSAFIYRATDFMSGTLKTLYIVNGECYPSSDSSGDQSFSVTFGRLDAASGMIVLVRWDGIVQKWTETYIPRASQMN